MHYMHRRSLEQATRTRYNTHKCYIHTVSVLLQGDARSPTLSCSGSNMFTTAPASSNMLTKAIISGFEQRMAVSNGVRLCTTETKVVHNGSQVTGSGNKAHAWHAHDIWCAERIGYRGLENILPHDLSSSELTKHLLFILRISLRQDAYTACASVRAKPLIAEHILHSSA